MAIFEPIFAALNGNRVRYVVVGGVAVVLHGHPRLTADLDLAVDLSPEEALKAVRTLLEIGLRATVPVEPEAFADPATRSAWRSQKRMEVFSMSDPRDPLRRVDMFVENPIAFGDLWDRSEEVSLATTTVRIASIPDLIEMKSMAGRPQDLTDIEALRTIAAERER